MASPLSDLIVPPGAEPADGVLFEYRAQFLTDGTVRVTHPSGTVELFARGAISANQEIVGDRTMDGWENLRPSGARTLVLSFRSGRTDHTGEVLRPGEVRPEEMP